VTVTTGGEVASLSNGFAVNAGLPVLSSLTPATAHQNDTVTVNVVGLYTSFQVGTTVASFGSGITVNSVTVTDATHAAVNITVSQTAAVGSRAVTLTTGVQTASLTGGFTVAVGIAYYVHTTAGAFGVAGELGSTNYVTQIGFAATTSSITVAFNATGLVLA
jgi:hypothetical protein